MTNKGIKRGYKSDNLRVHKHVISLNDIENKVLNRYLKKYNIRNKSKFIRESLITSILKKFEEDTPTLFD